MGLLENTKGEIFMGKGFNLKISKNRCKGCGLCIEVCPQKTLKLSTMFNESGYHFVEISEDNCKGCKRCTIICPDTAIEIFLEEDVKHVDIKNETSK
jgi:2-oxoglutarate ferredoxin oxidoreductase subunit delta